MNKYPKYKPSNIDFLGDIPEEWDVAFTSLVFNEVKCKNIGLKNTNLLSLSYGRIKRKDINSNNGLLPESFETYNVINKGDIVFRLTDLQNDQRSLRTGLCNEDGIITSAYLTLRPKSMVDSAYYHYVYHFIDVSKIFYRYGGGVRQSMNFDDVRRLPIPLPPLSVQSSIAAYLDSKTDNIDRRIALLRSKIEHYKQLRRSLISDVVTRGLNKNVNLKKSVSERLGYIPEHWFSMHTINALSMPITDGPHTTPEFYDSGIPFVSAEAVSCGKGRIDFDHIRGFISKEFYDECCLKYVPQINDIFLIKSGATTGRVAIVDTDKIFTIWSPLAVFRCNTKILLPYYLFYFVQSSYYQLELEVNWSFGTQQNIGMRSLEKIDIAFPPIQEQKTIIKYLDEKTSKIDAIVEKCETQIEQLAALRRSLIAQAVTGQIKVC